MKTPLISDTILCMVPALFLVMSGVSADMTCAAYLSLLIIVTAVRK